ncbi:MAG: GNAT family N-acetyltransferase [Propylenella sp.]
MRLLAMPPPLAARGFSSRSETEADVQFLRRLYASTRWEELAPVPWTDGEKVTFLESQFALQRHHYLTYYAATDCAVLEKDGVPAGRLYVDRGPETLLVVDLALLPEWRGQGVGTALMLAVMEEARAAGKSVTVTVEKQNRAELLYKRLGFREISDEGAHSVMEWRADEQKPAGVS